MSTKAYLYTGHSVLRIIKQDVYCINGKNMRSCKDCINCDSPTNYHGKARCGTDIERTTKAINCLAMKRLLEAMAVVLRRTFQKDSQFCSTLPIRPAWHDHAQTSLMITCSRVLWTTERSKGLSSNRTRSPSTQPR